MFVAIDMYVYICFHTNEVKFKLMVCLQFGFSSEIESTLEKKEAWDICVCVDKIASLQLANKTQKRI